MLSIITLAFIFVFSTTVYVTLSMFYKSGNLVFFGHAQILKNAEVSGKELKTTTEKAIKVYPEKHVYSRDEVVVLNIENKPKYDNIKIKVERFVNDTKWLKVYEETVKNSIAKITIGKYSEGIYRVKIECGNRVAIAEFIVKS